MNGFEKHYAMIKQDVLDAREILEKRQKEIQILKEKQKSCRNGFRRQCITQELERLEMEYQRLDALI